MKNNPPLLTLLALVMAGLAMRPLLTSVSTLLPQLHTALALSTFSLSILPALPMVMMGLIALVGAFLLQRHPPKTLLIAGLTAILISTAWRVWQPSAVTLLFTAVTGGLGIGLVQMVMPALIRQRFPARAAAVTGLWAGALMGGGGLGAAITPWVALHSTLATALASSALVVVLALLLWLRVAASPSAHVPASARASAPRFYRIPRAWSLAVSFGLVNGTYASLISWLPQAYVQLGWSAQQSGTLLALMIGAQVLGALVMPLLVRGQDRRGLLLLCLLLQGGGLLGFLLAPQPLAWLWACIAGVGLGGAFPLTLVLALEHLPQAQQGAKLVAFVQGVGFMLAGMMPFIAGQLAALTGSLQSAWLLHLGIVMGLIALNLRFHPHSYQRAFRQS